MLEAHPPPRYPDLLLYTAKGTEFTHVQDYLRDKGLALSKVPNRDVWTCPAPNQRRIVLATGSRQGPEVCAATLTSLLHEIEPRRVIMVGMCASPPNVPKLRIGKVVLGLEAINYQEGKIEADGKLSSDGRRTSAHNRARALTEAAEQAGLGVCANFISGSAVVENGAIPWHQFGRKDAAFDMEASAFFTACELFNEITGKEVVALGVVKGVADHGDAAHRGEGDKDQLQLTAVRKAAEAALFMFDKDAGDHAVVSLGLAYLQASKAKTLFTSQAAEWRKVTVEALLQHTDQFVQLGPAEFLCLKENGARLKERTTKRVIEEAFGDRSDQVPQELKDLMERDAKARDDASDDKSYDLVVNKSRPKESPKKRTRSEQE